MEALKPFDPIEVAVRMTGGKIHRWVADQARVAITEGPSSYERIFRHAFVSNNDAIHQVADLAVFVIRLQPDQSAIWMQAMVDCLSGNYAMNSSYIHGALLSLFQGATAMESIPSKSTMDFEDFRNRFPEWLSKLLLKAKIVDFLPQHEKALGKAIAGFVAKVNLSMYYVRDAMLLVQEADDKHLRRKDVLDEFVIRSLATEMMGKRMDIDYVVHALSVCTVNIWDK